MRSNTRLLQSGVSVRGDVSEHFRPVGTGLRLVVRVRYLGTLPGSSVLSPAWSGSRIARR